MLDPMTLSSHRSKSTETVISTIYRGTNTFTNAPTSTGTIPPTHDSQFSLTTTWPASLGPIPTAGEYDCPSDHEKIYHPVGANSQTFIVLCDVDFTASSPGIDGGRVFDLQTVIATSIESCIEQCVVWNTEHRRNGMAPDPDRICKAVTYDSKIFNALGKPNVSGNCYLKNQRSANVYAVGQYLAAESAFLQENPG
jgi:hypothetical protein